MVTEYGMSADIGAVKLGQSQGEVFLGRDMGHQRDYSEEIAEKVDLEVRKLIEQAHDEAWKVLNDNRDILDDLARQLLEKETLDHLQLAEIFENVRKLDERPQWPRAARGRSATSRRSRSRERRPSTRGRWMAASTPSRSRRRALRGLARTPASRPRNRMTVDRGRVEAAVAEILAAIGDDPARPGLADTPRRVADAYVEYAAGIDVDPVEILKAGKDAAAEGSAATSSCCATSTSGRCANTTCCRSRTRPRRLCPGGQARRHRAARLGGALDRGAPATAGAPR